MDEGLNICTMQSKSETSGYAYPDDQAAEHVVFEDLNLDIRQGKLRRRIGTQRLRQIDAGKALKRHFAARGRQRDGLRAGHEAGRKPYLPSASRWAWCSRTPTIRSFQNVVEEDVAFAPENLGVASEEIRRRVDAALEAVGMLAYKKHAPHLLSGGQKQRVAIAGVLAMQPKTIVLDEPTAMLDPQGRQEVVSIVEKLSREQNITVVLITHHMDEAVCADRVIAMDDGKIIADGTPKEVFVQIELLKRVGLTVPQTTLLLDALNQDGCALPLDALSVDECADALYRKILQAKA